MPHIMSLYHIISLCQINICPKCIFPIHNIHITHMPNIKNLVLMDSLPYVNPHRFSLIAQSVPSLTLPISTLPNNVPSLPTILNRLVPLELLHSNI